MKKLILTLTSIMPAVLPVGQTNWSERRRCHGFKKMKIKKNEKIYQTVLSVCETNLSWRGRLKERGEASKDEEEGEVARWSILESGKTQKSHLQIPEESF